MTATLLPVAVLAFLAAVLIAAGLIEYSAHQRVLAGLPLRIHVNGTRGKSSVTRLIAAGLRAGGLRTFAKTTGTAPRVIDPEGRDHIIHRLRSASIGEQVRLLRFFAREKPDAVVMECMAVQPQYQWVSEQQMIRSHIGVIGNVRPDHLDEMGSTPADIARSLGNTIPRSGKLVTADKQCFPLFEKIARRRRTVCTYVDEKMVSREEIQAFKYLEHPQNVSIALKVCELAGVDRRTALEGMRSVQPDLGALAVWSIRPGEARIAFVNGMAANDPVSTLHIWNFVIDRYPVEGEICVFLNTREDRLSRTRQLMEVTLEEIKPDRFVIRGENISAQVRKLQHYSPGTAIEIIESREPLERVLEAFRRLPQDSLVYAIGNQVGSGQKIVNMLRQYRVSG